VEILEILEREETKCAKLYLDEYRISALLRNCIRLMKKSEISEVEVLSNGKVQYGLDFELLSKAVTPLPEKFKYIVKVYTFTEGRHTYNMTLDEKVLHAQRKRLVGVHWINVIFSFHHLEPLKLQKSPQNL
jgi:hypothetical protein